MRVLIIGGAGLLGSKLASEFQNIGLDVAICDNFSGSMQYRAPKNCKIYAANATDLNSMGHVVKTFSPEVIVLSVGHYFQRDSIYRFYEDTRLCLDSANVLSYLLSTSVKKVIFCSSHEVYGGSTVKLREAKRIKTPYSYHGAAKLAAEGILEHRCQELGIDLVVARIFDLFGPRIMFSAKTGTVSFLIDSLLRNEMIGLAGPRRKKDFIHVNDAADAICRLTDSGFSGTVNVGTGIGTDLRKIVSGLANHIDFSDAPMEIPEPNGHRKSLVADVSVLSKVLGNKWKPRVEIISALPELIEFRKKEFELYSNKPDSAARVLEAMRGVSSV